MGVMLTARVLRTIRKSVISAPACPPTPIPAEPIALGADHACKSGVVSASCKTS